MSKYRAKKIEADGMVFASRKEYSRWQELKLLERAGRIKNLQTQVRFELIPAQYENVTEYTPKTHKPKTVQKLIEKKLTYVADFVYNKDGEIVVEDVKGYRESGAYNLYVIKRKLMLYIHGIRIKEV